MKQVIDPNYVFMRIYEKNCARRLHVKGYKCKLKYIVYLELRLTKNVWQNDVEGVINERTRTERAYVF